MTAPSEVLSDADCYQQVLDKLQIAELTQTAVALDSCECRVLAERLALEDTQSARLEADGIAGRSDALSSQ